MGVVIQCCRLFEWRLRRDCVRVAPLAGPACAVVRVGIAITYAVSINDAHHIVSSHLLLPLSDTHISDAAMHRLIILGEGWYFLGISLSHSGFSHASMAQTGRRRPLHVVKPPGLFADFVQ